MADDPRCAECARVLDRIDVAHAAISWLGAICLRCSVGRDGREVCMCGRPRSTPEDLRRWFEELDASGQGKLFNPDWARALCWMKATKNKCPMKHLNESERSG